jgi:hypothetical protein
MEIMNLRLKIKILDFIFLSQQAIAYLTEDTTPVKLLLCDVRS